MKQTIALTHAPSKHLPRTSFTRECKASGLMPCTKKSLAATGVIIAERFETGNIEKCITTSASIKYAPPPQWPNLPDDEDWW
ncbi:hypothetical protein [Bifidobacterium oedipodis]|uniref:Uncharacterized protein n=1 Tax=Bifidobacterium oedipodis TaxID=2675322 RepID=A0A7Y0ERQ4_9BIFI|nr:hypothetical protein [Bifidobacterium sp. DSM 109957]NMM95210.1 hypothetical protein [Bifidobacterium sp. DSM 109957]